MNKQKIQTCAASPWTYRTDTGDKHGKVVESAELPEEGEQFLSMHTNPNRIDIYELKEIKKHREWFSKHLIAWAVIQGGK